MFFMTEIQEKINQNPITSNISQEEKPFLKDEQAQLLFEKLHFLSNELKTVAMSILESLQTEIRYRRRTIISLLTMLALLGTTGCSEQWQERWDAQFDPTIGTKDPLVIRALNIDAQRQAEQAGDITEVNPMTTDHEAFEIPATDQRILPGSRVRVVETGVDGLNIRAAVGTDTNLVANIKDGIVFQVIELAGEKDGYSWVLVKSEAKDGEKEIVGYAATDWFQVLRDEPVH